MRVLALLFALAPPAEGAPARVPEGAIGIHWRRGDGETSTEVPGVALESDLREGLAALDGRPVATIRDHALVRARRAVSRELPAGVQSVHGDARAALDDADAAFRDGRFVDARAALTTSLDLLEHNPELPGVAGMVRETRLVEAAIAWAEGDRAAADLALIAGLAVDPEATLSTRSAPPELVDRYRALQIELLGSRATWIQPAVDDPDLEFVIDGVPGLRPLPPGEHFVAVYRDGHEPVGLMVRADELWSIPAAPERIPDLDPDDRAQAELVCRALDLELLVLAERRGEELGLQAHLCGSGFGPNPWFGGPEELALGIAVIVDIEQSDRFDANQSSLRGAWPVLYDVGPHDFEPTDQPKRPWYRKGWVWGTTAGVVVLVGGAIAAGVLLGQRSDRRGVSVDANDFIGN